MCRISTASRRSQRRSFRQSMPSDKRGKYALNWKTCRQTDKTWIFSLLYKNLINSYKNKKQGTKNSLQ